MATAGAASAAPVTAVGAGAGAGAAAATTVPPAAEAAAAVALASAASPSLGASAKPGVPRCGACKKKVGVTAGFECRCGTVFCAEHRYPDAHGCTYDFKSADRAVLSKNNPRLEGVKMERL